MREYQIEVNPKALQNYRITIMDVMEAVQKSNLDIGAETIVALQSGVPVRIKDVAFVSV